MAGTQIRSIEPGDDATLANIIRTVLEEFGANKPGTVYFDRETDHLYDLFSQTSRSVYQVAVQEGKIVGGV